MPNPPTVPSDEELRKMLKEPVLGTLSSHRQDVIYNLLLLVRDRTREATLVVRCSGCRSSLIYKRINNGEIEVYHSCPAGERKPMTNNPDPVALAREMLKAEGYPMFINPTDVMVLAKAVLDQDARFEHARLNWYEPLIKQDARIKELEATLHDVANILGINRALIVNALNTEEWHGE